jgi:signal transduction histidine kinase
MPFSARTSPPNVLVVDDDEGLSILIVESLKEARANATPVYSASEAIGRLAAESFDLMLLDLGLKDIDGAALLESLKHQGLEIPFIVVTGRGDERTAVEMMKQGALEYLIKDAQMLARLPMIVTRAVEKLDKDRSLLAARAALLESEKEILVTSERERQSIGADLHDNLGQQLTAIELLCQAMREDLKRQPNLESRMAQICRYLQEAVGQTRLLAKGLNPVLVDAGNLSDSLTEMVRRMGSGNVSCSFECPAGLDLTDSVIANHLFRIAQEAVNNALKHGKAKMVKVRLVSSDDSIVLKVQDDGIGLSEDTSGTGIGLKIMRHRSNVIGASLEVASVPGRGVTITCTVRNPK